MSDDHDQLPQDPAGNESRPQEQEARSRPLFQVIGVILIALSIILGVYGIVTYAAWQRSQDLQAENEQAILQEEIDRQMALVEEDIAAGNLLLAVRRLDWILERNPDNTAALQARQLVESLQTAPTATPRATATVVRQATATPSDEEDPELAAAFDRLGRLVEAEEWSEVITALVTFQSAHPNYRRQETDRLLYDAYIALGQSLLGGEQVELGLAYLSQAELLGNLPQEVEDQRIWAELYLQGIAYYGVDWETAVYFFRDLCAAAPFYQESCQKLGVALTSLGDIYAANLDWCPARSYYAEAAQVSNDSALPDKIRTARSMCLEATPTPSAPITGTESIDGILPTVQAESAGQDEGGQ